MSSFTLMSSIINLYKISEFGVMFFLSVFYTEWRQHYAIV